MFLKNLKPEQYYKPEHDGLNKENVWNKMLLNGIYVLILQEQIS